MIGPRKVDKPLVLYGYGKLGHLAEEIFKELKIPLSYIIDKNRIFPKNPEECWAMERSLLAICVASEPYNQVVAPLKAAGWTDIVPVWDIIDAYPEVGIHNGWVAPWCDTSFEEEDECDRVMAGLGDKLSKIHYERGHLGWRRTHYEQSGLEITPREPLPSTLADIRRRQRVDTYADAPMKTIDIHNEGCELKTLEVNMPLFQKYRPSLSVAVYHSRDGLYKIEKFCMENLPDYRWTFRLTAYCGQGAYLIGCPKERL